MGDSSHSDTKNELYSLWYRSHIRSHGIQNNLILIAGVLICIPFDYLFFGTLELYTPWRLINLGVAALSIIGIRWQDKTTSKSLRLVRAFAILPFILLNCIYALYLAIAPEEHRHIVLNGFYLIILFTVLVFHRFFFDYIILAIASLAVVVFFHFQTLALASSYLLVEITLVVTAPIAFAFYRIFVHSLKKDYKLLAFVTPPRVAKIILTSSDSNVWDNAFKPQLRYCACISADWRGYQNLITNHSPAQIEDAISVLYGAVYRILRGALPQGTFFPDWSADELFLIIYDEDNDPRRVNEVAVKTALVLANNVYDEIVPLTGLPILYDIGVSAGIGLLGLQGPEGMRKTTVLGPRAGVAKRLQTAAKGFRDAGSKEGLAQRPILLMDAALGDVALELGLLKQHDVSKVRLTAKDLDPNEEFARVLSFNQEASATALEEFSESLRRPSSKK